MAKGFLPQCKCAVTIRNNQRSRAIKTASVNYRMRQISHEVLDLWSLEPGESGTLCKTSAEWVPVILIVCLISLMWWLHNKPL